VWTGDLFARTLGRCRREACSSRTVLKIGVKRSQGLAAVVGKRLDLAVARASGAAERAGPLQFSFR
jgi:hypothetical protein